MILTRSTQLTTALKEQYDALLLEADNEPSLYGIPLVRTIARIVLHQEGKVIGVFEPSVYVYDDVNYYRTNRPFVKKEFRGKGWMEHALKHWYLSRRPGWAWIDDDNTKSIQLFVRLGFTQEKALQHKGKDGHVYLLN